MYKSRIFTAKIRWQVQLEKAAREIAVEKQSLPDANAAQPSSGWERSQEFTVSVEGQEVRVNFRAFYFSTFGSSKGYHHFEFHGHSTSPTGYRSDFLQAEQAANWSSPSAYAQQKAQELHTELLKEQRKQQRVIRGRAKHV